MLHHVIFTQTMKYLSYQTLYGDAISHVTMAKNVFLACYGNTSKSIRKQQTWLEGHCYGSFRNGRRYYGISKLRWL